MRNQTLLDRVLGGNQRVEFSRLYICQSFKGKTKSLATKKTDIPYVRSSRNSNLMNMLQKMFGQNSLGLASFFILMTYDDEGPPAGSNQGRSAKRRRPESAASGSAQPPSKD
ncbi:hypothetical protein Tco_1494492, partial [Tanacetum coccineum]